jgi:hypothetical protein
MAENERTLTFTSTARILRLMNASAPLLQVMLAALTQRARARGWSDAEWARRSGLPKETLCRLRARTTCDLVTLTSLAESVGATLDVPPATFVKTRDGRFPTRLDRALEARLIDLVRSGSARLEDWRREGPAFFMAGLAVVLASAPEFDRRNFLELAEALHPGVTEQRVFEQWLKETPWKPSRFMSQLRGGPMHAA